MKKILFFIFMLIQNSICCSEFENKKQSSVSLSPSYEEVVTAPVDERPPEYNEDQAYNYYLKRWPLLTQNLYNFFNKIQKCYRDISDYESACGQLRICRVDNFPDVNYEKIYEKHFYSFHKFVGLKVTVVKNKLDQRSSAAKLLLDAFDASTAEGFSLISVNDKKLVCTCAIPSQLYNIVSQKCYKDNLA